MRPRKENDLFSSVCLKVESAQVSLRCAKDICTVVGASSFTDETESQLLEDEVLRHLKKATKILTETIEKIELSL